MDAVEYLLARQRSRDNLETRAWWAAYLGSLAAAVFACCLFKRVDMFYTVAAVVALVTLPVLRALHDSSTLYSLLVGGAYAEIRQTRLAHREIIDALHFDGMKFQALWGIFPACALAFLVDPWKGLDWFLVVMGLTSLLSYACLFQVTTRHTGSSCSSSGLRLTFLVVCSMALSLHFAWIALFGPMLVSLLLILRQGAIDALARAERLSPCEGLQLARPRVSRRMHWMPWSENPIVGRECARESNYLGGNWLTVGWHFFGFGIVTACALAYWRWEFCGSAWEAQTEEVRLGEATQLYWFLLVLGLIQALRAGFRVSRALAEERDRKTLDVLLLTSLGADDFVSGWAQVGYQARQLETFWIAAFTVFVACLSGPSAVMIANLCWAGMLAVLLCSAGSYLGLLVGFRSCMRNRGWRDFLWPLVLGAWGVATFPLLGEGLLYVLLQAGAAGLLVSWARRSCRAVLLGG